MASACCCRPLTAQSLCHYPPCLWGTNTPSRYIYTQSTKDKTSNNNNNSNNTHHQTTFNAFPFLIIPHLGITPDEHQYFHFIAYAVDILFSLVDLHRLYVAYRPTTGGVQVSFNIWSIGTTFMALINIVGESFDYFVPEFKDLANSATFAAEIFSQQNLSMPMLLPEQATQVTTLPTLFETVWKGVESWTPSVLNIMLGLALWTILNQRWQLDHEQEERLEQQGYHLLGTKSDLPAPIASALTVDGFKTEAEIRRLRLRVPTWPRLIMGLWFLVEVYHGIRGHPRSLLFLSGNVLSRGIKRFFVLFATLSHTRTSLLCLLSLLTDPRAHFFFCSHTRNCFLWPSIAFD